MDRLFNKVATISISFRNGKFISRFGGNDSFQPDTSEPVDEFSKCGTNVTAAPIAAKKVIGSVERVENDSLIIKFDGGISGGKYIRVRYCDIELIDFRPIVN